MDGTTEPTRSKQPMLLPWTEPELGGIDAFVVLNPLYPASIVTIYQIVRDLHIKQEVIEISVVDACKWNRKEYFIQARTRANNNIRLMVPFYLDAEIDLPWLRNLSIECKAMDKELYICIHTPETIMDVNYAAYTVSGGIGHWPSDVSLGEINESPTRTEPRLWQLTYGA